MATRKKAARIVRIGVALGVNGVVMVLGVGRVDGDERKLRQILATCQRRRIARAPLSAMRSGRKTCGIRARGWR